jgi:hypothetical protein
MMQSRHIVGEALLLHSTLSPVALSLYLALAHSDLAFNDLAKAAMAFLRHCAGVLACIALASLPASLVAGVAPALLLSWLSKVQPLPRWRLLVLRSHFACIALASLPALCCHPCCRRCAGVIALIAWALLRLLCWHHCPPCHCIAASIANWRMPCHKAVATCAGIIASIAPLLLLA